MALKQLLITIDENEIQNISQLRIIKNKTTDTYVLARQLNGEWETGVDNSLGLITTIAGTCSEYFQDGTNLHQDTIDGIWVNDTFHKFNGFPLKDNLPRDLGLKAKSVWASEGYIPKPGCHGHKIYYAEQRNGYGYYFAPEEVTKM